MEERELVSLEIERARGRLDDALERAGSIEECYALSLELDTLIEKYLVLCGQ